MGSTTLRHPGGEDELEPGDVVCFPDGPEGAHKLTNRADETARVMILSTFARPAVAIFPDSDKLGVWPDGDEATIVRRELVDYWEGERVALLLRRRDHLHRQLHQRRRGLRRHPHRLAGRQRALLAAAPERAAERRAVGRQAMVQRRRLVDQRAADHHALDLARALEDRVELRVAVPLLDRQVAHVAVAAADLDRLLGGPHRDLGRLELRHRALAVVEVHVLGAIQEARQVSSRAASSSVARSASANEMPCLSRIGSPNASRLEA